MAERFALLLPLVGALLAQGCEKHKPPASSASAAAAAAPNAASAASAAAANSRFFDDSLLPSRTVAERNAALLRAVGLLAEKRPAAALEALREAQRLEDGPLVRQEIERVQALVALEATATAVATNIAAILEEGDAASASLLAGQALGRFGGTSQIDRLLRLKRQADALLAQGDGDRRARLRVEAEKARGDNNLRTALLAFEQLAALGDAEAKQSAAQVRAVLARHEAARQRAAELRRDPQQLEEALSALKDAAGAWDTPETQQEIADLQLARAARRDRLAVADFEIRGDIGFPGLGRALSEGLLPEFMGRFELAERSQLSRTLEELKLGADGLSDNEAGRRELARLARVRYLVIGSVTPLGGVTASARLVDARSGLIVQTARLSAASPEELLRRLPDLARQLLMSDEERLAWDAQQAASAVALPPAPAAPPTFAEEAAEGAPIVWTALRPPALGTLSMADFERLPPPPPPGQTFVPPPPLRPAPLRSRMIALQLELADDLFRRGCIAEAYARYDRALNLEPDLREAKLRLNACRRRLPPSFEEAAHAVPPRSRIALLSFLVLGAPSEAPPQLSQWIPERLAPFLSPPFEIVDRGEVWWFMDRLGLSVQTLMQDAEARRWLGRALGARYFLLGVVRPTDSFTVATYLVDAEFGHRAGEGSLFVRHPSELRLRIGELAQETLQPAGMRLRLRQEAALREAALLEAQHAMEAGQLAIALDLFGKLKNEHPFNVQINFLAGLAEDRALQVQLHIGQRQERDRRQAALAAEAQSAAQLALAAEEAQRQAIALAAKLDRRRLQAQRDAASDALLALARAALAANDFTTSLQLFGGAAALRPDERTLREFAAARATANEAARRREADFRARMESESRRRAEAESAEARAQFEADFKRRWQAEQVLLQLRQARDQAACRQLVDEARKLLDHQQPDSAIAALAAARRLQPSDDEIDRLIAQAQLAQAKAQGAGKAAELELELAAERTRRQAAEAEAKQLQQKHHAALQAAEEARRQRRFDAARAKYLEAAQLLRSDAALAGVRACDEDLALNKKAAAVAEAKSAAEASRTAAVAELRAAGERFEKQEQWEEALKAYREAVRQRADDVELLAAVSRVEIARDLALTSARLKAVRADKDAETQTLADLARASLAARQFAAAEAYLAQLQNRQANHPATLQLQQQIAQARAVAAKEKAETAARAEAEAKAQTAAESQRRRALEQQMAGQREQALKRFLELAQAALRAQEFESAQDALRDAARLAPTDPAIGKLQRQLADGRAAAAAAKKKADAQAQAKAERDEKEKEDKFRDHVKRGRAALGEENFEEAVEQLRAAVKLYPGDTDAAMLLGIAEKKAGLEQPEDPEAKAKAKKKAEEEAKAKAAAEQKEKESKDAKRMAEEQEAARKRQAAYQEALRAGQAALGQKKHDEAIAALRSALELRPNDAEALRLLEAARQGKSPAPQPTGSTRPGSAVPTASRSASPPVRSAAAPSPTRSAAFPPAAPSRAGEPPAERVYREAMKRGQQFDEASRPKEAIGQYQAALKAIPNDARAAEALRKAEFAFFVAKGKEELKSKKADAAAASFEEALRRAPGNPEATRLLQEAKQRND